MRKRRARSGNLDMVIFYRDRYRQNFSLRFLWISSVSCTLGLSTEEKKRPVKTFSRVFLTGFSCQNYGVFASLRDRVT